MSRIEPALRAALFEAARRYARATSGPLGSERQNPMEAAFHYRRAAATWWENVASTGLGWRAPARSDVELAQQRCLDAAYQYGEEHAIMRAQGDESPHPGPAGSGLRIAGKRLLSAEIEQQGRSGFRELAEVV